MTANTTHAWWHTPNTLTRMGNIEWTSQFSSDTSDEGWEYKIERALKTAYPEADILIICLSCMYSGGFDPIPIKPFGADQYWTRMIPEAAARIVHLKSVNNLALLILGQSRIDPWFHAYLQATHGIPLVCLTLTKYINPIMAITLRKEPELWSWLQKNGANYKHVYIHPFLHGHEIQNIFNEHKTSLPDLDLHILGGDADSHVQWNNKLFVRTRASQLLGEDHILRYKAPTDFETVVEALWQFIDTCKYVKVQLPNAGGAGGLIVFNTTEIKELGRKQTANNLSRWLKKQNWSFKTPILVEEWLFDHVRRDKQGRSLSLSSHAYINPGGPVIFRGTKLQLWYNNNDPRSGCSGGIGARYIVDSNVLQRVIQLSHVLWDAMMSDGVQGMASPDWIILEDGRVILIECNVRWSDTSAHDGVEMWSHPFDFMGDCLPQANEQLVIPGKLVSPRDMILYFTRAAILDGIEKQISFRFITPVILNADKVESKITVVISSAHRNDLSSFERINLVDNARRFFKRMCAYFITSKILVEPSSM